MARRKRGQNGQPWLRTLSNGVKRWYLPKGLTGGKLVPVTRPDNSFIDGEDGKQAAMQIWHGMMSVQNAPDAGDENLLRVVFDLHLQWKVGKVTTKTLEAQKRYFQDFEDRWPGLTVRELKSFHVQKWFDEHPKWGPTFRRIKGEALKAALNWAAGDDGGNIISKNPLKGLKLPRKRSRGAEALISEEDHRRLLAVVPEELRNVLIALRHLGARPSNVWRAEARNLDRRQQALVYGDWNTDPDSTPHKTFKKTGRPLVIPLTPLVFEICCRLADKYPTGPLFRTKTGLPWDPDRLGKLFAYYAKKKLGLKNVIPYGYRHSSITNLLLKGVPAPVVAPMHGLQGTTMINQNYGHVDAFIPELRETLTLHRPALPEEIASPAGTARPGEGDGPAGQPL